MKEFDRFSFPRNYSGKVPLFFRKFPEKFRRKFPEISELTTLHAGIVSKRIDIIKLFLGLVAPPLWFSNTKYGCEILLGMGACHSGVTFKLFGLKTRNNGAVLSKRH